MCCVSLRAPAEERWRAAAPCSTDWRKGRARSPRARPFISRASRAPWVSSGRGREPSPACCASEGCRRGNGPWWPSRTARASSRRSTASSSAAACRCRSTPARARAGSSPWPSAAAREWWSRRAWKTRRSARCGRRASCTSPPGRQPGCPTRHRTFPRPIPKPRPTSSTRPAAPGSRRGSRCGTARS